MKVNSIINGRVVRINKTSVIVKVGKFSGLLHISDISDYFVANIHYFFEENRDYDFIILEIDERKKRLKLGWKQIVPRFVKNPFTFEIKETPNGFKTLKESNKGEEND